MVRLSRIVLIAENNSTNRYTAYRTLRQANFDTIEAGWGREAVEQARLVRPDIIILDTNMPDQSGLITLSNYVPIPVRLRFRWYF